MWQSRNALFFVHGQKSVVRALAPLSHTGQMEDQLAQPRGLLFPVLPLLFVLALFVHSIKSHLIVTITSISGQHRCYDYFPKLLNPSTSSP